MKTNFTIFKEFEIEVNVTHYTPERSAPLCMDHDSPRFGDPGDDEEVEFEAFIVVSVTKMIDRKPTLTKVKIALPDDLYEVIEETVLEKCREKIEDDEDAYIEGMMRKAEGER
jgi:hypothetical protein